MLWRLNLSRIASIKYVPGGRLLGALPNNGGVVIATSDGDSFSTMGAYLTSEITSLMEKVAELCRGNRDILLLDLPEKTLQEAHAFLCPACGAKQSEAAGLWRFFRAFPCKNCGVKLRYTLRTQILAACGLIMLLIATGAIRLSGSFTLGGMLILLGIVFTAQAFFSRKIVVS